LTFSPKSETIAKMKPAYSLNLEHDRSAACSERRGAVEFVGLPARQILNHCSSERMPFRWTVNPYRGCEFGCVYCYARYTHEFLELREPMDFERRIFVKRQAAEVLEHSLARTAIGRDSIALGTATDPYQPAERRFGVTRSLLKVFARVGGLRLSITTKSALIARDIDLLRAIADRSSLTVNFSLITLDRRLQRALEPRAPRPELRLNALRTLSRAGIECQVLMMPLIPGLTDHPASIRNVLMAAMEAGAHAAHWRSLFLKPAAAARFIPFVRERFPQLARQFDEFYARNVYAPADYDRKLGETFERIKRELGYASPPAAAQAAASATRNQLSLGLGA